MDIIEQLERRVNVHNHLVTRMSEAEKEIGVITYEFTNGKLIRTIKDEYRYLIE